jgi:hypothetical protein
MKSVKEFMARILGLDTCVSELSAFAVLIELILVFALVILFSLPCIIW